MTTQITNKVKQCQICMKFMNNQQRSVMSSHDIPTYSFQYVSMDVFMINYEGKPRNFLVTVDHYSDYFELDILKNLTPKSLTKCCKMNFSRHGIPARIYTDNGTNFNSNDFKKFCNDWDIEQVFSSPHHARGNGKAESAVKIAKRMIKKTEESNEDSWYALLHWRNTPNKINSSPVQRLYFRNTRNGISCSSNNLTPKIIDNVPANIETNKCKSKQFYDKSSRYLPKLKIGETVFTQLKPESSSVWAQGYIEKEVDDNSYIVMANGSQYRRNRIHIRPNMLPISEGIKEKELVDTNNDSKEERYDTRNDEGEKEPIFNDNKNDSIVEESLRTISKIKVKKEMKDLKETE